MIEYYVLIVIGVIGLGICSYLLFRMKKPKLKTTKTPQISQSEQNLGKMKFPPAMKHWKKYWENPFKEIEEEEI